MHGLDEAPRLRVVLTHHRLADLAQAKNDLLAAVETYLAIVREVTEI